MMNRYVSVTIAWFVDSLWRKLEIARTVDTEKLARVISAYVTVVTREQIGVGNGPTAFPKVTRSHEIFAYTREQMNKTMKMLSATEGVVENSNVQDLFGANANAKNRDALMHRYVNKLVGKTSKSIWQGEGGHLGGPDIGRVSGWSQTSTPAKFAYVDSLCRRKKRIVLYSRFGHVARRLIEYLKTRGHGSRIYDGVKAYPSIDITALQRGFFGSKDIVVLHPNMSEGIGIKGASTLVLLEPFTDVATKQQVEARVVRMGSHAAQNDKNVAVVTCVTGIELRNNPFVAQGIFRSVVNALYDKVRKYLAMVRQFKFDVVPVWLEIQDIEHLHLGPEVNQEQAVVHLEETAMQLHRKLGAIARNS